MRGCVFCCILLERGINMRLLGDARASRDGLLEVKNWLNVTRCIWNGVVLPAHRASIHTYTLNTLGQRTSHHEDMSQYYNGVWSGLDRNVTRSYGYDDKGQVISADATYNASGIMLNDPLSEKETYDYDEIGNREDAILRPKPNMAAGWQNTPLPAGTGDTYDHTASATNSYTEVAKTNAPTATAIHKYDADGNLTDDGKFVID